MGFMRIDLGHQNNAKSESNHLVGYMPINAKILLCSLQDVQLGVISACRT